MAGPLTEGGDGEGGHDDAVAGSPRPATRRVRRGVLAAAAVALWSVLAAVHLVDATANGDRQGAAASEKRSD